MKQTPAQIFFRFLRFGCLAWGGPVAQIAMIRKELVDEEQWVTKERFNRALAVYQALPGPEAHELCVYFGMLAGGRLGGLLAGLGFMLPGFFLILFFTWIYVRFGIASTVVQVIFAGIQAAVISLIVFAVYRIGKHAVTNAMLLAIALLSAIAFALGTNFLIILPVAGLAYLCWRQKKISLLVVCILALTTATAFTVYKRGLPFNKPATVHAAVQATGKSNDIGKVFITGLKGGLLTFGGAYTAIPFIQQDAVQQHKWMTQEQFLDGIALSGILPAPLIIFSTFVGYFGGGWLGAILITAAIFFPAFAFTLLGHSVLERLIAHPALHSFLDGITAGVVGLIAVTAIQLFITTVTSIVAILVFIGAVLTLIKFRSKYAVLFVITGAGLFSLAWHYIT